MHALMQAKQGDSRTMIGMTIFVSKLFMLIVAYDGMHFMTMQAFESSVIASIAVVQILTPVRIKLILPASGWFIYFLSSMKLREIIHTVVMNCDLCPL